MKKKKGLLISILTLVMIMPCAAFANEDAKASSYASDQPVIDIAEDGVPAGSQDSGSVDLSGMSEETAAAGELLVLVKEGTSKRKISGLADDAGATLERVGTLSDGTKLARVSLDDPEDAQTAADSLASEDKVLTVQPNYRYRLEREDEADEESDAPAYVEAADGASAASVQTDAVSGQEYSQWHLGSGAGINAEGAWSELSDTYEPVTVAVIDTGVKLGHEDLQGRILADKCVTFNDGEQLGFRAGDYSDDEDGHGTHVCGLIAANASNSKGVKGVANDRARLIVIDAALPGDDGFMTEDVVLAIDYAVSNGASLINMSLGALYHDYLMEEAMDRALDNGVLCICAAGNEASGLFSSPGDLFPGISVMSHKSDGNKSQFSNHGQDRDVSAPGSIIWSTDRGTSSYSSKSGTSMASPIVTGLAALLLAEKPELSPRELKNFIYTSSGSESFSPEKAGFGFGKVNALNAVTYLKGTEKEPQSVELNRSSLKMYPGEYTYLEYAVYPGAAGRHADEMSFTSSDSSVAEVDEKGVITAKSAGTARITASCRGASSTCTVEVIGFTYERISALPYTTTGYFSPTDLKLRMDTGDEPWEGMTDGYELYLEAGAQPVDISVRSSSAAPYIRIFDQAGSEQSIRVSESETSTSYNASASFAPSKSGVYRILIMGNPMEVEKEIIDKAYTLDIHVRDLSDATVGGIQNMTYTGSPLTQNLTVIYNGTVLREGSDYALVYQNNVNAGTAAVTVKGSGSIAGSKTLSFTIYKAESGLSVKGKTVKIKYSKVKKKAQKLARKRIITAAGAAGRLSYIKVSGSSRLSINRSSGKVTVKKKTKKGTYRMKVRIIDPGDANHNAAVRYATVKVKVR